MRPSWRDRLRAAPLWVLFIYYAVAFGALGLILPGGSARTVSAAIVTGLLFGGLMTAMSAVWRRRDRARAGNHPGTERAVLERALRTGELPADPALDSSLIGLIRRRREQLAWASKAGPVIFGFFAVVSGLVALSRPIFIVYAIGFAAFIYLGRRSAKRSEQRFAALERAVAARLSNTG